MQRILVVLWHPQEDALSAGGFRRTCEILQRFPKDFGTLEIIDAAPSYMEPFARKDIRIHPYTVPSWISGMRGSLFPLGRVLEWFWSVRQIIRIGKKLRGSYDYIYVPYSEIFVTVYPAVILKKISKAHLVLCNLNSTTNPLWRWLMNRWHNYADTVMTISNSLADQLHEQGISGEFPINYTGLDVGFIKKQPAQKRIYDAIFVGRHVPEKGIEEYLKLLPAMVKEKPDFTLVSIGSRAPAIEQLIQKTLRKMGLEKHWVYKGIVSEEEKYALIAQSKVMWFLSHQEGWGIVPQEALACGTFPLCYSLPVYKESIAQCPAATFVKQDDWPALERAAIKLLRMSDATAKPLRADGKKFVEQFDWEAIAKKEFAIITNTS